MKRDVFFTGWSGRSALPLAWFLGGLVVLILGGLGGLALALGVTVSDPGGGTFLGDRTLSGTMVAAPYPVIVLDPDADHPLGHAVLLSGGGKRGVQAEAAPLDGKRVKAAGGMVMRGTIEMLLVADLVPDEGEAIPPPREALGFWRLTGEICDGKCVIGVMHPGNGPAHKACANICVTGGVPPVLVTTAPVAGTRFLLMGDPAGQALPEAVRDRTAIPIRMDGSIERMADLLVFRTDVAAAVGP